MHSRGRYTGRAPLSGTMPKDPPVRDVGGCMGMVGDTLRYLKPSFLFSDGTQLHGRGGKLRRGVSVPPWPQERATASPQHAHPALQAGPANRPVRPRAVQKKGEGGRTRPRQRRPGTKKQSSRRERAGRPGSPVQAARGGAHADLTGTKSLNSGGVSSSLYSRSLKYTRRMRAFAWIVTRSVST
jgi:hypothetical protein